LIRRPLLTGDEQKSERECEDDNYKVGRAFPVRLPRREHVVEKEGDAEADRRGGGGVCSDDTDDGCEQEAAAALHHFKIDILGLHGIFKKKKRVRETSKERQSIVITREKKKALKF